MMNKLAIPIVILIFLVVTILALTESGKDPYKCSSDGDCVVKLLPVCIASGCSPPCGHVYEMEPKALNKNNSENLLKETREREEKKCREIECIMCAGLPPLIPKTSTYKTRCNQFKCTLEIND
jgi:hypothetical protein